MHNDTLNVDGHNPLGGVRRGDIIFGKIIEKNDQFALLDISCKTEGMLSADELDDTCNVGEKIEVFVEKSGTDNDVIIVSRKKASRIRAQEAAYQAYRNKEIVTGTIIDQGKNAFKVRLASGLPATLPYYLANRNKIRDVKQLINKTYDFLIIKYSTDNKNNPDIVISRRELLAKQNDEAMANLRAKYKVGDTVEAVVTELLEYGAFVDIDGYVALLHVNEMAWAGGISPQDIVQIGDKIRCKLIEINAENNHVLVSLKQITGDPWESIQEELPIGTVVEVTVKSIKDYGLFINIHDRYQGLVHISEISWDGVKKPLHTLYKKQQKITAKVINIDFENKKIAFSIKRLEKSPLETMYEENKGKALEGKIVKKLDHGLIVEFPNKLRGFLYYSKVSRGNIHYTKEDFSVGDTIVTSISGAESDRDMLKLNSKHTQENPWKKLKEAHQKNQIIPVTVVNATQDGLLVALSDEIHGFIHRNHLMQNKNRNQPVQQLEYTVGETLQVIIQEINQVSGRVLLSERLREEKEYMAHLDQYLVSDGNTPTSTIGDRINKQ